jgi:hypothetical protein
VAKESLSFLAARHGISHRRPEAGLIRASGHEVAAMAITEGKQIPGTLRRDLLHNADSALPVDGEFAMGEVRRAARSVALAGFPAAGMLRRICWRGAAPWLGWPLCG